MADLLSALGSDGAEELYTEVVRENLDKRTLIFNDDVNDCLLENYIMYILRWNREDHDIPVEKRDPITIICNSGGGDAFAGNSMIDLMLASETPINTVCVGICASMMYHIFLAGTKRVAFKNSVFLQHDGEVNVKNSTSKARDTMKFFEEMESRTKDYVLSRTTMSPEFYDQKYDNEFWMYASEAKELGIVTDIVGEDVKLSDIF